jgi:hypothetical protein
MRAVGSPFRELHVHTFLVLMHLLPLTCFRRAGPLIGHIMLYCNITDALRARLEGTVAQLQFFRRDAYLKKLRLAPHNLC